MKVKCAFSGLTFEISGFPGYLPSSAGYIHPAHFLKLPALARSVALFESAPERFTESEAALLFSSLLNVSGLVRFTNPLPAGSGASAFKFIPRLASLISDIFALPPAAQSAFLPTIVIQSDMDNWKELFADWEAGISCYYEGIHKQREREKLDSLTSRIQILNQKRDSLSIARKLNSVAEWASIAGEFPSFETVHPCGTPILCNSYWKELIRACSTSSTLLNYPIADIQEMLDHCYEKIAVGDDMAHELFGVIEGALERRANYLKFGTDNLVSISAVGSRIIFDETYVQNEDREKETAALDAIKASAPMEAPARADYPDNLSFIRAKLAFAVTQKSQKGN